MKRCLCLKLAPVSTAISRPFQKSLWKVEGTWRTGSRPIFVPDTVLLPTRIATFYIASDLRVLLPFYFFEVVLGVESKEEGEMLIPPTLLVILVYGLAAFIYFSPIFAFSFPFGLECPLGSLWITPRY